MAWTILGFDAHAVLLKLAQAKRHLRVEMARQELELARKAAKRLLSAHHPDRGGDPEMFRRVVSALEALETHTEEFARKMAEQEKTEEEGSKRPFIKLNT